MDKQDANIYVKGPLYRWRGGSPHRMHNVVQEIRHQMCNYGDKPHQRNGTSRQPETKKGPVERKL